MSHQPKNVLVTGGCGFIGSNFINFNPWPEANIVNVDKLILNSDINYVAEAIRNSPRYKLVLGDVGNSALIKRVLEENNIDTVVHFAADCTSTRCYADPCEALQNNLISFIEFLEVTRQYGKVKKFVHISTDEVYGDSDLSDGETPKTENELLRPGNPYAATKIACEAYVSLYQHVHGLPITTLRINNIYGPHQWDVKLVPRFIEVARKQEKFTVQGTGKQLRSWLYVDDASAGIRLATEKGKVGEVYNLGTYFEKNVIDVAHAVQAEVDKQLGRSPISVEFQSIPDRPYNDLRYLIDYTKAKVELGWEPAVSFEEGLSRVVASALKPHLPQKMSVILYGGRGWVGLQVQKLLTERQIPYHLAKCKPGVNTEQEVIEELNQLAGTHVLNCTGRTHGGQFKTIEYLEGGPDKAYENVRDNLYCPVVLAQISRRLGLHYTYVGTGYLFAYDKEHTVGGKAFHDDDDPTFFGNSYSVAKGFADRMVRQLATHESINARITLPVNFELSEERNLLTKIIGYKSIFEVPVSITILPDCLPILIDLMERHYNGSLNLVNPEPIALSDILHLYRKVADPDLPEFGLITIDSEMGQNIMATKGNCALDTARLQELCPSVNSSTASLTNGFKKLAVAHKN